MKAIHPNVINTTNIVKKIVLFATFTICSHCGFAQDSVSSPFTKDKAVATVRANYLYIWFRYPEDTMANVDRLIDNMNKAVPVDKERGDKIRASILFEIERKQPEKGMSVNDVLSPRRWQQRFNLPDFIPIMGINANHIIKNSFDTVDYELIYNRLVKERIAARNAYGYLSQLYNKEKKEKSQEEMIVVRANPKAALDAVFEHFGI